MRCWVLATHKRLPFGWGKWEWEWYYYIFTIVIYHKKIQPFIYIYIYIYRYIYRSSSLGGHFTTLHWDPFNSPSRSSPSRHHDRLGSHYRGFWSETHCAGHGFGSRCTFGLLTFLRAFRTFLRWHVTWKTFAENAAKIAFGEGRCFCWGGLVEVGHKGRDVCFGGSWWSWQRQFWGETLRKTLKSTCSLSGLDVFFLNVPTQYICFLHGEGFAYRREIRAWLLKPHTLFHFFLEHHSCILWSFDADIYHTCPFTRHTVHIHSMHVDSRRSHSLSIRFMRIQSCLWARVWSTFGVLIALGWEMAHQNNFSFPMAPCSRLPEYRQRWHVQHVCRLHRLMVWVYLAGGQQWQQVEKSWKTETELTWPMRQISMISGADTATIGTLRMTGWQLLTSLLGEALPTPKIEK